jgi:hypothetical protein
MEKAREGEVLVISSPRRDARFERDDLGLEEEE